MPKPEPIWKIKGFESEYDYLTYQAKEEGFRSLEHKYTELFAKQKGYESNLERRRALIENAGFESFYEYRDYLAKRKGFKSDYEYREHLMKSKGFTSRVQYHDYIAKRRGFSSGADYFRHLRREHKAKLKGFESHAEYEEHLVEIEESIKSQRKDVEKKDACKFLQDKIAENVNPQSLFAKGNVDFLRKITGCKIPIKEENENTE